MAETCASFRSTNLNGRELCHSGRTIREGCVRTEGTQKRRKNPREREREKGYSTSVAKFT